MVMAGKKFTSDSTKKPSFFQKHWWKIGISLLFVTALVFFGYNKYLDQQNVSNMKQLLSDFEKLKVDVETETGEKLFIKATCGSVGKFATSYACDVTLGTETNSKKGVVSNSFVVYVSNHNGCEILNSGNDSFEDALNCTIHVRGSNTGMAEQIFIDYDTSPGSAI